MYDPKGAVTAQLRQTLFDLMRQRLNSRLRQLLRDKITLLFCRPFELKVYCDFKKPLYQQTVFCLG